MRFITSILALAIFGSCPALAQTTYSAPASTDVYSHPDAEQSMPLKPQTESDGDDGNQQSDRIRTIVTVGGSLAVVLGIFFGIMWLLRRAAPGGAGTLPAEVFEVIGRAPLASHQHVQLIRFSEKLLLVAIGTTTTAVSAATLAEITDPVEMDRMLVLCRHGHGGHGHASHRQSSQKAGGTL